jgi:hypothetical protein
VRWVRLPNDVDPWGVIRVRVGDVVRLFRVRELLFDVFDGRGFLIQRPATRRTYHVEVSRSGRCHCDCAAADFWGRCVHSQALARLLAAGHVPDPAGPAASLPSRRRAA